MSADATMASSYRRRRGDAFRPLLRFACTMFLLTTLPAMTPPAVADDATSGGMNYVYVEGNDPTGNVIYGFARQSDGSLVALPRSPYRAGGLGITPTSALGPFDSDQNLIVNPDHTQLFAVNGGSDSIAVFDIAANGVLTLVPGAPFPSQGSNPVSVGLAGDVLCVVNKDQDPDHPGLILPNYTSFRVNPRGQLSPVPRSTVFVDAGASPSQALPSPDGTLLFGADFMGGLIRSFDSTGSFLHVVTQNAAQTNDASANALHVFKVAQDGTLTEVLSSPTLLPVQTLVRPQGVAAL